MKTSPQYGKVNQHAACLLRRRGFTIIELMVVISIMLILISVAAPIFSQSVIRARESVLRQNLFAMRVSIDQFAVDKGRAPQSLQDLVQEGYLREIPTDPMTSSSDTWEPVQEDYLLSIDQQQPGLTDVRSGAPGVGSNGTPYSEW
ncbi:MAG: type II secretion system protein [Candidatus Korobacteraceae bacterium]